MIVQLTIQRPIACDLLQLRMPALADYFDFRQEKVTLLASPKNR
jgi:hypothetical protein